MQQLRQGEGLPGFGRALQLQLRVRQPQLMERGGDGGGEPQCPGVRVLRQRHGVADVLHGHIRRDQIGELLPRPGGKVLQVLSGGDQLPGYRHPAIVGKAVVQQLVGILVLILQQGGFHGHRHQCDSVPLHHGGEGALGAGGPAGFGHLHALVIVLSSGQEPVLVLEAPGGGEIGGGQGIADGVEVAGQPLLLPGGGSDQSHIVGGGGVGAVRQTVGVGKMGVRGPQGLGCRRHLLREGLQAPRHRLGQHIGGVVGGLHADGIQRLLRGQLLPRQQGDVGGAAGHRVHRGLGNGKYLLRLQALHRQKRGHQLGDAGRVERLVHILFVQHRAGVRVQQHRRLAGQRQRLLRPRGRRPRQHQPAQRQAQKPGDPVSFPHVCMAPIKRND